MPQIETCRERALSEEYKDYIIGRVGTFWGNILEKDICRLSLDYGFQIAYANQEELSGVPLYKTPYYSIPKCYTLLDTEALQEAGIAPVQQIPGLELTGANVIIGFIDTGINYELEVFRRLDGSTRIRRIWDQTIQNGKMPNGLWYGSEYAEEEINEALRTDNPRNIVPSSDENGHGTFVASIACGSGVPEEGFLGAAPEAELVVVKLKEAKQYLRDFYFVKDEVPCYQENDIMAALHYLQNVAKEVGKPLVICMSVGTSMGGHSAAAPLSSYIEVMGNTPLIAITAGTGNEADKRHHTQGMVSPNETDIIEINVGPNVEGFYTELWTEIPNIFTVTVTSPSGETSFQVPIRNENEIYEFLFENTRVYINYRVLVESTNSQVVFLRFENPLEGIWKVNVTAKYQGDGNYHIWLPMNEFLDGEVFFLQSTPDVTIMSPGNVQAVTSCAFYNGENGGSASNSGRGFTRLGGIKPDIAVPGMNILGVNQRGQTTLRSGSSIASALAAGAAALIFEWLVADDKTPDSVQVKNLLILGAVREREEAYPNPERGYGNMNLYNTFLVLRNI